MADLLRAGQQWLASKLKSHASSTVVYVRGTNQVSVLATIGRTLMKLDDGYGGVRMQWTDRDFLINPADLVLAGSLITPERGDTILETVGTKVYSYEVNAPGGEPAWRWSDPHRSLYRIHTKEIGIA
ncbi:MAG: hypothetical protein KGS49_18015 [Planctomycetes bacterium]|nr:hypothetical protein [Planctomycetota bacterium]